MTIATGKPVTVTPDNFVRAETDMYFGNMIRDGALGEVTHTREPTSLDNQIVIRLNRDTLYSSAVFDLDAGPVAIIFPNPGDRFMSMMIMDEDEYVSEVIYDWGRYAYSRDKIGTRYFAVMIRIFVNPNDPADLQAAHALQDAVQVVQKNTGRFEVPDWDAASQKEVRDALGILGRHLPDSKKIFGKKTHVDPVRHLIGAAAGWGGNPERDASYVGVTPSLNDGKTAYRLRVMDVPVDGFWSVTVYNKDGYLEKNKEDAYSFNNVTAKKDADGAVTIQFGGDSGKAVNYLPITPGWNYVARMYRPRAEILSGQWTFPEAQPLH